MKAGGAQSRVGGCHAERPHPVLPGPLGRLFFPSSAHRACGFGGSPALAAPCFLPWDGFPAPQPAPHLRTSRQQARSSRCCRAEPCAWLAERARSGVGANRAHGHIQRNREICASPAKKAFISGWDPGEPRHKAPRTLRGKDAAPSSAAYVRARLSRLSPSWRSASTEAHLQLGPGGFDGGWLLIAAAIKCCVGRKTRHRGSALSSGFVSEPGSLGRARGSPRRAGSRSTLPQRRRNGPERRGHLVQRPQRGRPRGPAWPCVTDGARRCPGCPSRTLAGCVFTGKSVVLG